jgi:hypothetical protein
MQVTLSIRAVPGLTKDERSFIKHYDRFVSCEFADLVHLLVSDYFYSPFNFIGYEQGTFNICSDASFVVIDVDSTSISIHTRLQQLVDEGLQCILATTSDPTNLCKYRILIPLDRPINSDEYRSVVTGIMSLGLVPDADPVSARPAQKMYSYANSLVLSDFTQSPLVVSDYLVDISLPEYRSTSPTADVSDILHEFDSYKYATKGKRTRSLLSAAYKCMEYGLTESQLEQVINYVNSLFLIPKSSNEVKRRVLNFIKQRRH